MAFAGGQALHTEEVEQLSSLCHERIEGAVFGAPGASLELNAGPTHRADRVAIGAGFLVEDRPESLIELFGFFEGLFTVEEGLLLFGGQSAQRVARQRFANAGDRLRLRLWIAAA